MFAAGCEFQGGRQIEAPPLDASTGDAADADRLSDTNRKDTQPDVGTDAGIDAADGGDATATCNYRGESAGVCSEGRPSGGGADVAGCRAPESYEKDESTCDDLDNDCNGVVDETCKCEFRSTSRGVCSEGRVDEKSGTCLPSEAFEREETSCDESDNDCDGITDEGCNCHYQQSSTGVCDAGTVDSKSGDCTEPVAWESDESTCDAKDNDCDGNVDEACKCTPGKTDRCYTGDPKQIGVGECRRGTRTCQPNGQWGPCKNEVTPSPESCDGSDDDCDGVTDESCPCNYNGSSQGVCSDGSRDNKGRCRPPAVYSATETTCDAKNNDCDGITDEGCPCAYDGKSTGVCGSAQIDSSTGKCGKPTAYESDESACDGKDNDCDGTVDENCVCPNGTTRNCYSGPSGTAGTGVCRTGSRTCTNGTWTPCQNEVTPSSETCNQRDDDCDRVTDEGCSCDYKGKSTGVCTNGTIGPNGSCQPPMDYAKTESTCDTRDNDCDGATDEGCPCDYKGKIDGVCGNATRDSGGTCQRPGQFEPTETTCDGKDNDCDGSTDEPSKCTQQKPPAEPISCSRGFDETVTVPGFEYKPSSLTVSPGKVVRWKFIHRAAHTTTSGTGFTDPNRGKLWDSGSKSRGDTYCVKFRKRGDYKYFCTFHGAITMSGVVKVR